MKKRILFGVTFFVGILLLTISLKNDVLAEKISPLPPEIRCDGALSCTSALDYCILDDCSIWAGWKP